MTQAESHLNQSQLTQLATNIKQWGEELGFQQVGICDVDLSKHEEKLQAWLNRGLHGELNYMAEHGMMRARPSELLPGTIRVISVRMDYLPPDAKFAHTLKDSNKAYISRYALGRDYHKLLRHRLKKLSDKIKSECEALQARPFVDSAPVLEHALAEKAGIGWQGKHSLTINKQGGSWFFLGELFINLALPVDQPSNNECGSCTACLTICPTQAIIEPYTVDAKRCISYLTIENKGPIPQEFRQAMGNRVYGCDDCQLVCPWNRYSNLTHEQDFHPRQNLDSSELLSLFQWTEQEFLDKLQGSPIRRIGFESWQRNLAVGLGNAAYKMPIVEALKAALATASELVKEHIMWAIEQQEMKSQSLTNRTTERLIRIVEKGLTRDA